jgi:hypothetical protein
MWPFTKDLVYRGWQQALANGSSTGISVFWLGFGVLALAFGLTVGIEWLTGGRSVAALVIALKSWKSWAGATLALCLGWLLLLAYSTLSVAYKDHQQLEAEAQKASQSKPSPTLLIAGPKEFQESAKIITTRIAQKGNGNSANPGTVGGSLVQGPCGIAQVGGSGNQASISCNPARRLTAKQIEDMKAAERAICPAMPHIDVTASNGNQEAQRYAMDFVNSLTDLGCHADLALPIPGLTPDVEGIHIAVRDLSHIDANAQKLGLILNAAQSKFTINPMKPDFFPNDQFVLVVGAAPPMP